MVATGGVMCSTSFTWSPERPVPSQLRGDRIRDSRQLVKVEVSAMRRQLPGHGEREADDLVQIEVCGVVANYTPGLACS
jgi:hypothetical protein